VQVSDFGVEKRRNQQPNRESRSVFIDFCESTVGLVEDKVFVVLRLNHFQVVIESQS
jgi:hypothetical protein